MARPQSHDSSTFRSPWQGADSSDHAHPFVPHVGGQCTAHCGYITGCEPAGLADGTGGLNDVLSAYCVHSWYAIEYVQYIHTRVCVWVFCVYTFINLLTLFLFIFCLSMLGICLSCAEFHISSVYVFCFIRACVSYVQWCGIWTIVQNNLTLNADRHTKMDLLQVDISAGMVCTSSLQMWAMP